MSSLQTPLFARRWLLGSGLAVACGCVSAGCASSSAAKRVQLVSTSSHTIKIASVRLETDANGSFVAGTVRRQPRVDDTRGSHLDIRLIDTSETLLAETVEYFTPNQIPTPFRGIPGYSRFRTSVGHPLEKIRRIEIEAHDAPHRSTL